MAALVHLVRHAEVENPENLVYGSMPGFGLSPQGLEQARRVGRYLGARAVVAIWSSPLEPALRTAEEIAARSGVPVRVDEGLRDWDITDRWRGQRWASVSAAFPEELEVYLDRPHEVDFTEETLHQVADRVAAVARRLDEVHPHGDVVIVSHQDPVQAGRLRLVGFDLSRLHQGSPENGAVITLRPGSTWIEETVWGPTESPRFGERSELRVVVAGEGPQRPTSA